MIARGNDGSPGLCQQVVYVAHGVRIERRFGRIEPELSDRAAENAADEFIRLESISRR
jgi:hypothetical protein